MWLCFADCARLAASASRDCCVGRAEKGLRRGTDLDQMMQFCRLLRESRDWPVRFRLSACVAFRVRCEKCIVGEWRVKIKKIEGRRKKKMHSQ